MLNPQADALGQGTLSAHGPEFCSEAGRRLLATLDPPPKAPAERAPWITYKWRTRILPNPPAASTTEGPEGRSAWKESSSPATLANTASATAA